MRDYTIRLVDGSPLLITAERTWTEDSRRVFERRSPGGGWVVVHEIHEANIAAVRIGAHTRRG